MPIYKAKKSLGQNFLKSEAALKKIIEVGEIKSSDIILEIGPGKGALTEKLLEKAELVVAVEKDRELFEFLKTKFEKEISSGQLTLKNSDILDFSVEQNILERTLGRSDGDGQRKFSAENFRGESEYILPEAAVKEAPLAGSLSPLASGALPLGLSACETPGDRTSFTAALFGIVQGGREKKLRQESARVISSMDFDGFGIGGSFAKEDMSSAVKWVNEILPEEKPRHLLGIGEPEDLFMGVENGVDLFDCVLPTRLGRNGTLYTKNGKIIITNKIFREDFGPLDEGCGCYVCSVPEAPRYSRAYIAHLFRGKEMLAGTLASIHNLYFITHLVDDIRQSLLDGNFLEFKRSFLEKYLIQRE